MVRTADALLYLPLTVLTKFHSVYGTEIGTQNSISVIHIMSLDLQTGTTKNYLSTDPYRNPKRIQPGTSGVHFLCCIQTERILWVT